METTVWAVIAVLFGAGANALGGFYLKIGAKDVTMTMNSIVFNHGLFFGVLFYAISTLITVPAYRFGQLSVLYPLYSTSYIWVTLLGHKYMNEKITSPKLIGIGMIIIGVLCIGIGA